jgi:hypothetical protein
MRGTGVLHSLLMGIVSAFILVSVIIVVLVGVYYRDADMNSEVTLSFVTGSASLTLMRSPLVFDCLQLCLSRLFCLNLSICLFLRSAIFSSFFIASVLTCLAPFTIRNETFRRDHRRESRSCSSRSFTRAYFLSSSSFVHFFPGPISML